jgi:tRNA-uridine 2-sulfurtransferase
MSPPLVILGMSGGVDSSVAAHLLLQQGYRVEGLFMSNWEEDEDGYCTAAADYQDARLVAEKLGIPLHKVNFAAHYRDRVFEQFLAEYRAGRTPNPDVLCNREIKFGVCFEHALRLGADLFATGHYARIQREPCVRLLKGADPNKDQSYFLAAVSATAFTKTLFPIGELPKTEVRRIAKSLALPVHDKKDSTGICFIGERPFEEFLSRYLPAQPGRILTVENEQLGQHRGLMYYTIGQRQGLGIGGTRNHPEQPWYVVDKDLKRNALIVGQGQDHPALFSDSLDASMLHWIEGSPRGERFRCTAKVRYRQADQPCEVTLIDQGARAVFDRPQRAVTPGQFVVFYAADECLGSGVIETTHRSRIDIAATA